LEVKLEVKFFTDDFQYLYGDSEDFRPDAIAG
jgi:hypothetical protein